MAGMEGCSHVVHGAALVYADGTWPKVRAVNVDGTRNVLTAAATIGVGHAVHISSVAVYGSVDGPLDDCTADFEDCCPDEQAQCGARFVGGQGCVVAGLPFCYDSGTVAYEVQPGVPLALQQSLPPLVRKFTQPRRSPQAKPDRFPFPSFSTP